jgi:eukaryotic-like serine/threonine-protein kinase
LNEPAVIIRLAICALALTTLLRGDARAQSVKPASTPQTKQERKADARNKRAAEAELPAENGATSTSRLALPFKRAWQYLTDGATTLAPSIDETRIYLPLAGGRVLCLDRSTGSLIWTGEPGGVVVAPVAVAENSVYIATNKFADDGSEAGGSLRAVDKTTGLTVWVKDYPRPFSSPLVLAQNRIYAGNADGSFYALDEKSGDNLWKIDTQDVVSGCALVTGHAIYFGGDDGAMRAVEPDHGKLIWKVQTPGRIVGQPAIDDRAIYFGSADGYVYSVDIPTGKLRWRSRTGAAIEAAPVIAGDRVLVASFDNFVYALARSTGDRLWKRRLENRITSPPIVEGDASLVAPLRGDYVAVFLNADGRRVNIYTLEKDFEIVADPIFTDGSLVLSTSKGLVVATATRVKDAQTRAVKK